MRERNYHALHAITEIEKKKRQKERRNGRNAEMEFFGSNGIPAKENVDAV